MRVTFSWDDGHPHDLRIAELMARHGIRGSFYCPIVNREGLAVMSPAEMRQLGAMPGAEVGAHTYSHAYASRLPLLEWLDDTQRGKDALEHILGQSVPAFCYPGGKFSDTHVDAVQKMGFRYARTTGNFSFHHGTNPLKVPTTLQFYPHGNAVLARNFIRHFRNHQGSRMAFSLVAASSFEQRIQRLLDACQPESDQLLHIWGHSWEIMDANLLGPLETLFKRLQERLPPASFVTNLQSIDP
jgi:peptidoglycan-N-acetylglucosamine deacetylase